MLQNLANVSSLKRVSVRYCLNVTAAGLRSLFVGLKRLECLDFSGCINVDCAVLADLPASIRWLRVEMLNLHGNELRRLAASVGGPRLEILSLEHNFALTDDDLRAAVPQISHLKQLNLANCRGVSHHIAEELRTEDLSVFI